MFRVLTLSLFAASFFACRKNGLFNQEERIVVREYPSRQPLKGASVTLYECEIINCAVPTKIGPLTSDANGEVSYETTLVGIVKTEIVKAGFVQTALVSSDTKEHKSVYYLAQPAWLHLSISPGQVLSDIDSCFVKVYQRDSILVGQVPYQGVFDDSPLLGIGFYYLNGLGGTGSDFTLSVAGGVYSTLEARIVRNGISRDTALPVFCPPGDTADIHFEY